MIKRHLKIVAITAGATMAITAIGTFALIHHIHKRRTHRGHFLSNKKRETITEVLELAVDNIPHGPVGAAIYHRHLQGLSDTRLVALYAAVKVGQYVLDSGIDPAEVTAEQLENIKQHFLKTEEDTPRDRERLLGLLRNHDLADIKPLLVAALGVLILI